MSKPPKHTLFQCFFSLFFVMGVLVFLGGCQSNPPPKPKYNAAIYYGDVRLNGTLAAHKQGIRMPVTGRIFEILNQPIVGIQDFAAVAAVEAGPPDARKPYLLVRLYPDDAHRVYMHTSSARDSYIIFVVNGNAHGAYHVSEPVADGDIPFLLEVQHEGPEDLKRKTMALAQNLQDAILDARNYIEYLKKNQ